MPGATPYVLVEERSAGGKQSGKRRLFQMILSIVTLILSGLLFVHGILSLITSHSSPYDNKGINYDWARGVGFYSYTANYTIRVFSAYLMIIALIFISVELKSTTVLTACAGMISPLGRGVIYLITGFLVFGLVGNWGICYGIMWMVCGVCHIILGARNCKNFYDEGSVDNGAAVVTRSVDSESTYESGSTEKNFCRSCGAALRPSDTYCPDCSAAVA